MIATRCSPTLVAMSFDLLVEAPDPTARARVSEAIAGHPVEIHESGERVCVSFKGGTTDAVVRKVYGALVGLAARYGYGLFDPQAGATIDLGDPQKFPPGWTRSLTFADVRRMTKKGQHLELLGALSRVADVDARDRSGETLLNVVLADAWDKGPSARASNGQLLARVAEDVTLELIARSADPMLRSSSGAIPIWWAVVTDADRLVGAILERLDTAGRTALLEEKFRGGRLLDVARSHRATRAEKALLEFGA